MSPEQIRFAPLNDGSEEDCQCARCGSSCVFISCDSCGGDGFVEDDPWDGEGGWGKVEYRRCFDCKAFGGWWQCCSPEDWCESNPMKGREAIKRGKIEWFSLPLRAAGEAP